MNVGPFSRELSVAVAAACDVFGRGRVCADLDVCLCPVSMTEEARAEVIAWQNAPAGSVRVLGLASDPDGGDDWGWVQSFAWAAGQFDAAFLPQRG